MKLNIRSYIQFFAWMKHYWALYPWLNLLNLLLGVLGVALRYTQAISVDSDSDSIGSVMGSLVALCFQLGDLVEPQIKRVRGLDEVQAVAERFLAQLGL